MKNIYPKPLVYTLRAGQAVQLTIGGVQLSVKLLSADDGSGRISILPLPMPKEPSLSSAQENRFEQFDELSRRVCEEFDEVLRAIQ